MRISNPGKVFFPEAGVTKLELIEYYLLSPSRRSTICGTATVLKRFPNGAGEKPFFQKRVPDSAPEWLQTANITFPSGRRARELTPNDAAHLVWGLNLGVIDWNPWRPTTPTSTIPTRCGSTSTRPPKRPGRRAPGGALRRRGLARARVDRLSEDERIPRDSHQRANRPRARIQGGPPRCTRGGP